MILEQSHRVWLIGSLVTLALGISLYVPYAVLSVAGVNGGSVVGLTYAGIGSTMMIFAGLLGARKRYRILRVGRAALWMRGHLWIGFLSFPFILFHAGFSLGSGALTRALMALFLVVFVSGLFGAVLQHFMPRMITQRVPMETVYEQIDHVLEQLVQEASGIISEINTAMEREFERERATNQLASATTKSPTVAAAVAEERVNKRIARFFELRMKPYLNSRQYRKDPLANPARSGVVFRELKVLVPENLWPKVDDLESICEEKRQLEAQRWLHKLLHGWLLFHIPASYVLLLLGAIHAFAALRY